MRDLLRMSEEELAELDARQAFRVWLAVGIASACAVLALFGMMARYSHAATTPLPGMNHFGGQIAWSVGLGLLMMTAAWLVRGVIMQRLQWAMAISLLLHLMFCVTIQQLHFNVPLPPVAAAEELPDELRDEMTLPDYGGMESPKSEAAWEQPTNSETPENRQDLERQKTELQPVQQQQSVEVQRANEVAKLEEMKRREQEAFQKEAKTEIERQMRDNPMNDPKAIEQPKVEAARTAQAQLNANKLDQDKQSNAPAQTNKQQAEIAAADQQLNAAKMNANRADPKAQLADQKLQFEQRQAAEAQAAAEAARENVAVAAAARASEAAAQARNVEAARQTPAGAPANELAAASDAPSTTRTTTVASARPTRSADAGQGGSATPTSGGAATIARNSGGQPAGAAESAAQGVSVAAAGGVSSPQVNASAGASTATRGTAATVPLGTAGQGTGATLNAPQSTGPTRGAAGGVARQATGAGQPQLGNTGGTGLSRGNTNTSAGAVGTQADNVAVASAAGTGTAQAGALKGGPANTNVGRQSSGLPGRATDGTGTSTAPTSSALGTGQVSVARPSNGTGLTGRATEPTARLGIDDGVGKGGIAGLSTARSGLSASLPDAATTAEQTGTLVFAGPQSQPSAGGSLAGPQRSAGLARRSAGLPGSGTSDSGSPESSASPSQPTRLTGAGPSRPGTGDDQPKLASAGQIAGLIKQVAPGIGASAEAKMSAGFSLRKAESRREATKTLGGSEASEQAVERGLAWLARHQDADGHWGVHELHCKDHECGGHGSFQSNSAATGLALLAFLGAGYTHQSGQHQAVVDRGVKWLVQHQKPDGDLFADESEFVWFYSHGMAAIALCEAYGMTKDPALREPAQKALNFIAQSQHPQFGGWRYRPKFESDTSVSGWQLMALKSGEMAGLTVPKEAYAGVSKWLDSVESKTAKGQFTYHPSRPVSLAMSAEGLLMRQYLGAGRSDTRLVAGADFLRQHLPDLSTRDVYYWYYATQVMFHMQGAHWDEWNGRLRDSLVNSQLKDGDPNGSWSPDRPTPDKWGTAGGRHYVTCLSLLMLEVYYRHLPLYIELGK